MKKQKLRPLILIEAILLVVLSISAVFVGCQEQKNEQAPSTTTQNLNSQPTTEPITEPSTEPATEPEEPEPEPEPEPEITQITLTFTGDCTLGKNHHMGYEGTLNQYYDTYGPNYFFENVRHIFLQDDLTIVNLEGSLTDSTDIQPHEFCHKAPMEHVQILTGSSVEVATMANNHRLDYGQEGCLDTVQTLQENNIAHCYDDQYAICEVKGVKFGFVSVNASYGAYVDHFLTDGYEKLRADGCDLVIACIHWGNGKAYSPIDNQLRLGTLAIDLGYDLVVGNHPHVLQGIQKYKGKYICYSLGNFCFGSNNNPSDKDCGIFQQTFTFVDGELVPDAVAKLLPCSVSSVNWRNDFKPTLAEGDEYLRIMEKFNKMSRPFGIEMDAEGNLVEYVPDDSDGAQ